MSKQLDILEKLKRGLSDREISKLFDMPLDRVAAIRKDAMERGLVPKSVKYMSREERLKRRKEIAAFVEAGNSQGEAAEKYGVSLATVQNAVAEFRKDRAEKRPTIENAMKAATMFLQGMRDTEIAGAIGVGRTMVIHLRKVATEAGLFKAADKLQKAAKS